jgi:methylglutaconyl-CoA hydratase
VLAAAEGSHFCHSEARIGLLPGTIGPYVMRVLGEPAARRCFITAGRFSAAEAHRLGFVQVLATPDTLDAQLDALLTTLLANGPQAVKASKRLLQDLARLPITEALRAETARRITDIRASDEGKEGISAFLRKRDPAWKE